jgi:hypothetical protein
MLNWGINEVKNWVDLNKGGPIKKSIIFDL